MSAMDRMLADMVMKAIPEEIRGYLTEENMNRVLSICQQFIKQNNEMYSAIAAVIVEQQKQGEMISQLLEKMNNDNGSSGGRRSARREAFSDQLGTGSNDGSH